MASAATALVLATLATKSEEVAALASALEAEGLRVRLLDLSLDTAGEIVGGAAKLAAMERAAARVAALAEAEIGVRVALGLGGGTGAELALRAMRALPLDLPKILLTPLPFDPRAAVADDPVILVPTLADICGMNDHLRDVFRRASAMAAGLSRSERPRATDAMIGVTALGATEQAVSALLNRLTALGDDAMVFHANGFGGAAYVRHAIEGRFSALIDLTPHELTRIHLAGAHVPMPERLSAGGRLPRVSLPGGLNFIGLGPQADLPETYRERKQYAHSALFTHIKVTKAEMARVATVLALGLNGNTGRSAVIVPMGGFSHQDRPGGAIEDPDLRAVFLETVQAELKPDIRVLPLEAHIFDPEVTDCILSTLQDLRDT